MANPFLPARKAFILSVFMLVAAPLPQALAADEARPNFIFFLTDDQRWDCLLCVQKEMGDKARFPWIRTPNLDRLAAEGVRFRNAFVVNSLCSPSRACFLTGQYNHLNGVANNHSYLPLDSITHATELRKAGYVTGYFGKWHHAWQPNRPGFDHYASYLGQGIYQDCPLMIDGKKTPTKGWVDDVTTDYAIKFIRKNKNKPFDMVLGFKSPHGPRTPPERYKRLYANETLHPAPNLGIPPAYSPGTKGRGPAIQDIRDYFRCIKAVDDNIGRVLKLLDELKLADNTVVIFASDNGYYLGEHCLGDKRSAYDESLRIPMLLRYPRLVTQGTTIDQMVLNIDLAPTLLDLAGITKPPSMQGRSWKPLLQGQVADWRKAFFYEYFREDGYRGIPTVLAVRTDTTKLIKYPGHDNWTELFDLKNDPYETKNLAKDPAHKALLEQMHNTFDQQAKAVNFRIPPYADEKGGSPAGKGKRGKK